MTNNIVEPDETSRGIDTQENSQSESEEELKYLASTADPVKYIGWGKLSYEDAEMHA